MSAAMMFMLKRIVRILQLHDQAAACKLATGKKERCIAAAEKKRN